MKVEFYGLTFETPCVSFYLWSPWRAAALEHKLFEAISVLPNVKRERGPDEWTIHVNDQKTYKAAMQALARVMKGWQEEADMGGDRRNWCWLLEGDTNADGYDHNGEAVSLWALLRVSLDRGNPGEPTKGEDIDLEGFSLRIWGDRGR